MYKYPTQTTEEIIRISLFKERVSRIATSRNDTHIPDSLGDQLVRMSLRLSWHTAHPDTDPVTPEILKEAEELVKLAEDEKMQKLHATNTAEPTRSMRM